MSLIRRVNFTRGSIPLYTTRMKHRALWAALAVMFTTGAWSQQDPCTTFTWDISHERALFTGPALSITAGTKATNAPAIATDRLIDLQLQPREHLSFALPPGKPRPGDFAGLVRLQVDPGGNYRIALDQSAWIDVIAQAQGHDQMLTAADFQGHPDCRTPHKIVEFVLPAHQDLLLQLSGAPDARLRLTVTRAVKD